MEEPTYDDVAQEENYWTPEIVKELSAKGLSTLDIALELGIGVSTVRRHL